MLIDSLNSCIDSAKKKNWNTCYIAVDLHGVVVKSNYRIDKLPTDFYPLAKETLQLLSQRSDIVLIMYTCSWPKEIEKYFAFFEENGINFKYANMNPDVPNNALGDYTDKMYYNLVWDDKGGFNPDQDWQIVNDFFRDLPLLSKF